MFCYMKGVYIMSTEKLNQNSTVVINADNEKIALLKQFLDQNNISPDILKTVIKKQSQDKFNYTDDTKTTAICNACDNEFIVADIPAEFTDSCHQSGICPHCAEIFAKASALNNTLKSKHISTRNSKIVNGGKNVGSRLKIMFTDAIKSVNFTEDIFNKFLDIDYSNKNLKFSSYPFLIDVTNITDAEQFEHKDYYKRFYSKPFLIFDKRVKMCSQIFDKQFEACQTEFKELGLISEDY